MFDNSIIGKCNSHHLVSKVVSNCFLGGTKSK